MDVVPVTAGAFGGTVRQSLVIGTSEPVAPSGAVGVPVVAGALAPVAAPLALAPCVGGVSVPVGALVPFVYVGATAALRLSATLRAHSININPATATPVNGSARK